MRALFPGNKSIQFGMLDLIIIFLATSEIPELTLYIFFHHLNLMYNCVLRAQHKGCCCCCYNELQR